MTNLGCEIGISNLVGAFHWEFEIGEFLQLLGRMFLELILRLKGTKINSGKNFPILSIAEFKIFYIRIFYIFTENHRKSQKVTESHRKSQKVT